MIEAVRITTGVEPVQISHNSLLPFRFLHYEFFFLTSGFSGLRSSIRFGGGGWGPSANLVTQQSSQTNADKVEPWRLIQKICELRSTLLLLSKEFKFWVDFKAVRVCQIKIPNEHELCSFYFIFRNQSNPSIDLHVRSTSSLELMATPWSLLQEMRQ